MLFTSAVLALVVASASAHSISHVHRRHAHASRDTAPPGWATGYLEDYDTYHARYLAIDCEAKHNTTTFDLCCHPLLATETLAKDRNPCCVPGATVACPGASSSLVASASASKTASAAAASSSAADDEDCSDDEDDNDDDDEDCEDDGDDGDDDDGDDEDCSDEESSTVATSTKAATTKAAVTTTSTTEKATSTTEAKPASTTEAQPTSTTEAKATSTTEAKPTTTSTEVKVATTPKATTTAQPTTTAKATTTTQQATTTSTASSSVFTGGFGTWFTQNGVAGACGTVHADTALIVALQTTRYDNGANCGRTVEITDLNNGKVQTATVADECPTCDNENCLDMSEGLFELFEDLSVGEMKISWKFTDSD